MNDKKINSILDIIIVVMIIVMLIATIVAWRGLPSEIPNHYDSMGNIKDYVSKNFIFFPSIIGSILGVVMLILSRFPKIHNYAWIITDKNREIQYAISTRMIRVLNIEMLLVFSYAIYDIINSINNPSSIFIMIFILFITLGYYIYKSYKYK